MKSTNSATKKVSAAVDKPQSAEQVKKYDSYRTDSGYNSCSCQSLNSAGSSSELALHSVTSSDENSAPGWDGKSPLVSGSAGSRAANISDSGLSLTSDYSSSYDIAGSLTNVTSPLNDLNRGGECARKTELGSDSGLGLDLDRFSKLSVDASAVDGVESLAANAEDILELARREEAQLRSVDDLDCLGHYSSAPTLNYNYYESWRSLKVIEDAFMPDKDGDTHLHLAIVHGRVDIAFALIFLAPHPMYLDLANNLHQSPLHLAVLTGLKRVVRHLVLAGASLDVRNKIGNTPLHLACERGDLDSVRELTKPVTYNEMQYLRLTSPRHYRIQDSLVPQNLELQNYEGQTCVHLAAINQHPEIIRHLNFYGANVNAQDGKGGRTPLCYAVEARNASLVTFLVNECHADMHATTYAGTTPFQVAYYMDPDIADLLLTFGAYPQRCAFSDSESDASMDEGMDICGSELNSDSYFDLKINGEPLW